MDFQVNVETASNLLIQYGTQLLYGLAILIIGFSLAKSLRKVAHKAMGKAKMDETLANFLSNIIYALLIAFVIIATLNKIGIQTASLVAVIGAAGLAIGLALQGSLSNFAAGVMIILFRHFKVGDYVDAGGVSGTVENLDIFNTTLLTPDNQKVIIPNASITSSAVTNYSDKEERRINLTIGIGYNDDIKLARKVILEEVHADAQLLKTPEPCVVVSNLGDNSVDLSVRVWAKTANYWAAYFALIERIKLRLDKEGISIPYPQRTIHMVSTGKELSKAA